MRAAALVVALVGWVASPARADGEGAVDLDLDAFADHLAEALTGEDDEVPVEAWEERLEPQAEDDWLAARGAREPEVDHPGRHQRAATVGLTVRLGDDLTVTRLVCADAARARAVAAHALFGYVDLPLGAGPSGRRTPSSPVLIEARGRDLLFVRGGVAADLETALAARTAAWAAPGMPAATAAVEGMAVRGERFEALACVRAGPVHERLDAFAATGVGNPAAPRLVHAKATRLEGAAGVGFQCTDGSLEKDARDLALGLAHALGLDLELPPTVRVPNSPEQR